MWRAPDQSCLIQHCFYCVSEGRWFLPSSRYDHGNNVNKRSNRQRLRPLMDQMAVESGSVDGHKSQIHSSLWWATSLLPNHGIGLKHTRKSWCAPLIDSVYAECKARMQNCEHVWEHREIMHDLFLCVVGPFFFFLLAVRSFWLQISVRWRHLLAVDVTVSNPWSVTVGIFGIRIHNKQYLEGHFAEWVPWR